MPSEPRVQYLSRDRRTEGPEIKSSSSHLVVVQQDDRLNQPS
jgi:hypothetical protein